MKLNVKQNVRDVTAGQLLDRLARPKGVLPTVIYIFTLFEDAEWFDRVIVNMDDIAQLDQARKQSKRFDVARTNLVFGHSMPPAASRVITRATLTPTFAVKT